jgi:hypothetical protein
MVPKAADSVIDTGGGDFSPAIVEEGKAGEVTKEEGNQVIVPKQWGSDNEEPFQQTVKRAIDYQKSQTPQERSAAISKEAATIPDKTAQTLVGAAVAGSAGPAALMTGGQGVAIAGRAGITVAGWLASHPLHAVVAYHLARSMGIPLPKAVDMITKLGGGE